MFAHHHHHHYQPHTCVIRGGLFFFFFFILFLTYLLTLSSHIVYFCVFFQNIKIIFKSIWTIGFLFLNSCYYIIICRVILLTIIIEYFPFFLLFDIIHKYKGIYLSMQKNFFFIINQRSILYHLMKIVNFN